MAVHPVRRGWGGGPQPERRNNILLANLVPARLVEVVVGWPSATSPKHMIIATTHSLLNGKVKEGSL